MLKDTICYNKLYKGKLRKGFISTEALGLIKGSKHLASSIQQMSDSQRGRRVGWHHTDEVKEFNRLVHLGNKARLGMKSSEETRRRISEARKLRVAKGELIGWKHTEEVKRKISETSAERTINGCGIRHRASYNGTNFIDGKEMLFAMWCDRNNVGWKYQPVIFVMKNGRRYIPDFLLLDSKEFVEIGDIGGGKTAKMNEFVDVGNVLHYLTNSIDLGDKTKWPGSAKLTTGR